MSEESVNKVNFEAKLNAFKENAKSYLNDYFKSHPNSSSEEPEYISLIREGYSLVSIVESLQQLTAQLQQESADKERAYTDEYIIRKKLQTELKDSQLRVAELENFRELQSQLLKEARGGYFDLLNKLTPAKLTAARDLANDIKDCLRIDKNCTYECWRCDNRCKEYVPVVEDTIQKYTSLNDYVVEENAQLTAMLKVLEAEKECIERQQGSMCDNGRDCINCDLALPDEDILKVYDQLIGLLKNANIGRKLN